MVFKLKKIQTIIYACFVMHNFCKRRHSVYINEEQVKTQQERVKTTETQFKNLALSIFSCVEGEGEVFRKVLRETTLKKDFNYLHFTALVLYKSCIVKIFFHALFS